MPPRVTLKEGGPRQQNCVSCRQEILAVDSIQAPDEEAEQELEYACEDAQSVKSTTVLQEEQGDPSRVTFVLVQKGL